MLIRKNSATGTTLAGLFSLLAALAPGTALMPFALGVVASDEAPADETEEEKKKREDKEKEEAKKKAEDDEKKKDEEAKAKAAASGKPGITAQLAAACASFRTGNAGQSAVDAANARTELAAEKQAHVATRATLAQRDADISAARASLASTEAALATLCAYVGVKPADVAGKSAAEINAALNTRVRALAIEEVKGLGFNPDALPAPSGAQGGETKTKAELRQEFEAITEPDARAAFYTKHKDQLLG